MTKLEQALLTTPGVRYGTRYGVNPLENETQIANALYDTIASRDSILAMPNTYLVKGHIEADLLTVTKKHLAIEWEIKRSRQDFLKDREKVHKRMLYQDATKGIMRRSWLVPNRYTMVLHGEWLKDEDWEHIPQYASVYVIRERPPVGRYAREGSVEVTFHLIKRGKTIHSITLSRDRLDDFHKRIAHRLMNKPPGLTQAMKLTADHYDI